MMRVRLLHAMSIDHPDNKDRSLLVRAGTEIELDDEIARRALDLGAAEPLDGDGEEKDESAAPAPGEPPSRDEVTLPDRPSNGGTKVEWRTYLEQLKAVTDPEMDEPLDIPVDATRDQMIQIGDERVAEWNEE